MEKHEGKGKLKDHDVDVSITYLYVYIYIYIYMSYHSANLQTLHFKYLFNKYTY